MLDHEEKFLFKEEILQLSNAVAEPGVLDNVEDLLTDVITSPRFDSEVFTLERSLQVMLGPRAGTTLVDLLTVAPEVFDEVAEVRIPSEVTSGWSPGAPIRPGHRQRAQLPQQPRRHPGPQLRDAGRPVDDRRVLQGRLTLVRYNDEPQFLSWRTHPSSTALESPTCSSARAVQRRTVDMEPAGPTHDQPALRLGGCFTLERSRQVMLGPRAGTTWSAC